MKVNDRVRIKSGIYAEKEGNITAIGERGYKIALQLPAVTAPHDRYHIGWYKAENLTKLVWRNLRWEEE